MKYSELKKLLKKNGCYLVREGANHEQWFSPQTGKTFSIGRHKGQEVASGTLKNIKRDAGLE
ncbi:type II toxin-antitoxin system HicA family toxin [uncultured Ruminococcus sp.]|uniref:type II toxin-antitoxin system HicA family toxin n=1 Tax=uncultured Ruminococcus sp. TaxID=165186 RepID=UPI0025FB49F1|nr:type II toxin-antitoxin system HicA family toxin [uncultured Ruminococcus sp.]